jgi:hypothetical protein
MEKTIYVNRYHRIEYSSLEDMLANLDIENDYRWVLIISFFELFVPPGSFMWNTTHFIYCKFNINLS